MPALGFRQTHCKHGHPRTPDNVEPTSGSCKTCRKIRSIAWRNNNRQRWREIHNASEKKRRLTNPESLWRSKLKSLYGLTPDQYNQMLEVQNGACAICSCTFSEDNEPCVDHVHDATKKVRALLCHACNKLIGFAKENCAVLLSAVTYLNDYSKQADTPLKDLIHNEKDFLICTRLLPVC